jgi:hypothetical protein
MYSLGLLIVVNFNDDGIKFHKQEPRLYKNNPLWYLQNNKTGPEPGSYYLSQFIIERRANIPDRFTG